MAESNLNVAISVVVEEGNLSGATNVIELAGGTITDQPKPYDAPVDEIDDYADAQFEPLMIIAVTLSLAALTKVLSDVWLDHTRPGGQTLDARTFPATWRPAPFLERGTLVVIAHDGPTVYRPNQKNEGLEAIKRVFGGG